MKLIFLALILTAAFGFAEEDEISPSPAPSAVPEAIIVESPAPSPSPAPSADLPDLLEKKVRSPELVAPSTGIEVGGIPEAAPRGGGVAEFSTPSDVTKVRVGARLDALFSAGGPVDQGFSLPSHRFWTSGMLGQLVGYRFSVGSTREFSTVMLPQLVPVEAYALVGSNPDEPNGTYLRIGMFRPRLNPSWSSDLGALIFPSYFLGHRALLFDNDIGVEAAFEPLPGQIEVVLGAMNGSGIFSLNTNSTKAMTTQVKVTEPLMSGKLVFGVGGGRLLQSVEGSVSYRSQWFGNIFLSYESRYLQFGVDTTLGSFQDATQTIQPYGASGYLSVRPIQSFRLFATAENFGPTPQSGENVFHAQVGPALELEKTLQVFLFYDVKVTTSNSAVTQREDTGQIRVRVSL